MPNFGVVIFPGSNCDHDCYYGIKKVLKQDCEFIWHEDTNLDGIDCVVVPGGFSYGDYLRVGAIARFSPVMESVKELAESGTPVLGICNGFQILAESGLIPGSFILNSSLKFICSWVNVRVENTETPFTCGLSKNEILRIPIANAQGNFFMTEDQVKDYSSNIVLRYCDENGEATEDSNPNGSTNNIAGISNGEKNVLGMMPHPERSMEKLIGSDDGRKIFESVIKWIESKR